MKILALLLTLCQAVDGDSLRCDGELIRIAGIDTPETILTQTCQYRLGRGSADWEMARGEMALEALSGLLASTGGWVTLTDVDRTSDRWERPLAVVWVGDVSVADWMIAHQFAVAYDGGRREAWCE